MSKRFIDTGFLCQLWIKKLTPERKSFLIYLMLKCDNAGIIELDMDDAEFWIGKKIGELSFLPEDYLIPISGTEKYFMPKFIEWQYGDLRSDKNIVRQARQILEKHNLINEDFTLKLDKSYIKVSKQLPELQVTSNSNSKGKGNIKEKEGKFKSEVLQFKNYPSEMLNEFINYWTEPNKSRTKLRYELEKTWDLSRRLNTWAKNDKVFKKIPIIEKQVYKRRETELKDEPINIGEMPKRLQALANTAVKKFKP